jgi:hypothetical protein
VEPRRQVDSLVRELSIARLFALQACRSGRLIALQSAARGGGWCRRATARLVSAAGRRPQVQSPGKQEPSGQDWKECSTDVRSARRDELTEAERRSLAATDGWRAPRKWVEVDRDRLQQALDHWKEVEQAQAKGIDFIQGMRLLSGATLEGAEDEDAPAAAWSNVVAGEWLRGTLAQMRTPAPDRACQPGRDLQATLRPYQVEGVRC